MYQLKAMSFWASRMICLCVCQPWPSICHVTTVISMLYLEQMWKSSLVGMCCFPENQKISSTSSCTGTTDQMKTVSTCVHCTESKKYVFSVDFCYRTVPGILFASSSHVFCDMAKMYNSGFTSIQLWPLWTCSAFCMFKLIMHFYFRLGKQVLSQWFPKKSVCLMGVCKTPNLFFPFLLSVSMGWAQGFSIEETLEFSKHFPWKYLLSTILTTSQTLLWTSEILLFYTLMKYVKASWCQCCKH